MSDDPGGAGQGGPRAFVIGHPIAHSRSPLIHCHWLRQHGLRGSYERIDVPPDELATFLASFASQGYVGGNVTVPHKEAVFRLLDRRTPQATRLGAVNTLSLTADGQVLGHNTDGAGWTASVADAVGPGWSREVRTALVIGAGGAARAIVAALLDEGVSDIRVANRTPERTGPLTAFAPDRIRALPWEGIDADLPRVDLVVNTTSLGMTGQPPLAIDVARLPDRAIGSDIVYVPRRTPLLSAAAGRGLRIVEGLGMLLHQAVPGFEAWFGVRPTVTPALRALLQADIERVR